MQILYVYGIFRLLDRQCFRIVLYIEFLADVCLRCILCCDAALNELHFSPNLSFSYSVITRCPGKLKTIFDAFHALEN